MKYRVEHEFPCDQKTLMAEMFRNGIIEALKPRMATIQEAETLSWEERNGVLRRRVRYLPVPKIASVGPKKVEPRWMEWVEESEVRLDTGTASYVNVPTTGRVAELLKNRGTIEFVPLGPGRTRRILSGELRVEVFLLGPIAERLIFAYAKEIVDEEARALLGHLADLARERP